MKTYISEKSLVVDEEGGLRSGQARRGKEEIIQRERLREFCTAFHSDMKIRTGRGKKSQIFANVTLVVDHAAVSDRGPVLPDGVHAVQRL